MKEIVDHIIVRTTTFFLYRLSDISYLMAVIWDI